MDRKLDQLFAAYREACPDVEGSVNFMPALWQKIESRQSLPFVMGRFARLFLSVATILCIAMSVALLSSVPNDSSFLSYVEVMDNAQPHETLAYADVAELDVPGDSAWR